MRTWQHDHDDALGDEHAVPAGASRESWPVLLRTPERLGPSPNNPTSPVYPLAANFANGVNLFHPDYQAPCAGRVDRPPARDQQADRDRGSLRWHAAGRRLHDRELERDQLHEQRVPRRVQAGAAEPAVAHRRRVRAGRWPACSFAYRGARTNPLDLPRGVQWTRRERRRRSRAVRRSELDQRTAPGGTRDAESQSRWRGLDTLHDRRVPHQYDHRRIPEELLRPQSRRRGSQRSNQRGFTKCDSVQVLLRRALSSGLAVDVNYAYARRSTATLDTLRQSRELVRSTDGVPHALKLTTTYELPFGRGKRYQSDANRWLDGIIGGWALNLAGRVQSGSILNFGNVRVVGMSLDELRDSYKVRFDDATGNIFMLPQDIIDNTIKAYSTSATTASGYGALGPPTGRYLAPANGADCIQEVRGGTARRTTSMSRARSSPVST